METSQENNEETEIPDQWKELFESKNILELLKEGYKPTLRKRGALSYLSLRKGAKLEKMLGPFDEELFHFIRGLTPKKPKPQNQPNPLRQYLSIPVARAALIPKRFEPSLAVIRYFEVLKERGYKGDFNQFINDIIETHFTKCHGIVLPVAYRAEGESA